MRTSPPLLALGLGLGLAACSSSGITASGTSAMTKSTLAALPVTSNMPTGTANYLGKMESVSSGQISGKSISFTQTGDFALAADFGAKTVQGTISNISETNVNGSDTTVQKFSGNVTGAGTISGSAFTIPKMAGTETMIEFTKNGVAQPITQPTRTTNSNSAISANFVGDAAAGFYSSTVGSSGSLSMTTELYGTKQ